MIAWSGRILVFLGLLHLVAIGVLSTEHYGEWFSGALWMLPKEDFISPAGAAGAFWILPGSFAVPLFLLGLMLMAAPKQGMRVPASIGWFLGVWAVLGAAILFPTPMILVLAPAVMIVVASNRKAQTE
ncbi:DUF6463 family protein [Salininema proteolyticum]|uniref:DUF6463 family protein n=1 Tax=Salininema proteolyticum TaxID=1607685 RepID=A0ABV8U248_9ACTN